MSMAEDDGVYRSERRRVQRRKKIAVGITGLTAILAGGGWAVSAWHTARESTVIGGLTPFVTMPVTTPVTSAPAAGSPSPAPAPAPSAPSGTASGKPSKTSPPAPRISGARQSARPSPTPSMLGRPDEEVASAQLSHLLRGSGGVQVAGREIVVTSEAGSDGSVIRVLSARHDLSRSLWAADTGQPVGDARCTQNVRPDGGPTAEVRPRLLLCWRTSAVRSVVTIATSAVGNPVAASSARVIDRTWRRLA